MLRGYLPKSTALLCVLHHWRNSSTSRVQTEPCLTFGRGPHSFLDRLSIHDYMPQIRGRHPALEGVQNPPQTLLTGQGMGTQTLRLQTNFCPVFPSPRPTLCRSARSPSVSSRFYPRYWKTTQTPSWHPAMTSTNLFFPPFILQPRCPVHQ